MRKTILMLAAVGAFIAAAPYTFAATILETTQLVAVNAEADAQAPTELTFTVQTEGAYTLTLTDLQLPARLAEVRAIVTRNLEEVAEAELISTSAAQTTETFTATPGVYRILVAGEPTQADGSGTYGVQVAPAAGGVALVSGSGAFATDQGAPQGSAVDQADLTIAQAGAYDFTLIDHQFPAAFASIEAAVFPPGGGAPVATLTGAGTTTLNAVTTGVYTVRVFSTASAPQLAGLYGVAIGANGALHRNVQPVGRLSPATTIEAPASGVVTITREDAEFPEPMTSFGVAVTQSGSLLQVLTGEGSSDVTVAQGELQLFTTGAPSEVGAFSVHVTQAAQTLYGDVIAIDASAEANSAAMYLVQPQPPVVAGAYRLALHDFRFPVQFALLDALITQGHQVVDMLDAPGARDVTLAADRVKVLVAARANAAGAVAQNGLFNVLLTAQPGGAEVFQTTQGVGGLFRTLTVQIPSAGPYDIRLEDLELPVALRTSALAVTRNTTLVGQIFGGGVLRGQQLTAGAYLLNFLGQPAANESFGAYGLSIADSAPAPTLTFTASPTSITSGQRATLQWTAANASSCTAAGGWSGAKSVSGSEQSAVLNANTSFDLTCTGPGGSASATASVTVNPPSPNGSGGGGGGLGALLLIYMSAMLLARRRLGAN